MLRSVFAIALLAACHPAPAPTVVHATARVTPPRDSPVRQDFEIETAPLHGPLREVIATGHECKQERPRPTEEHLPPLPEQWLGISVSPAGCERHRELPHEPPLR